MGFKDAKLPALHVYSKNSTDIDDDQKIIKYDPSNWNNTEIADLDFETMLNFIEQASFATRKSQLAYSQITPYEENTDSEVRFPILTAKLFKEWGLDKTEVTSVAFFNKISTKYKKFWTSYSRYGKLSVIAGERRFWKYDYTANHNPDLSLPKTPIVVLYDKYSEKPWH